MTNWEMINFINGTQTLGQKKLPIKVTAALLQNIEKLKPYINAYNEAMAKAGTDEEKNELLNDTINIELKKVSLDNYDEDKYDLLTVAEYNALLIMVGDDNA